jgi:quercetin dioxygenase-like cupin family protein
MLRWARLRAGSMITLLVVLSAGTLVLSVASDQTSSTQPAYIRVTPGEISWEAGPPSLPAGAMAVVIEGDPKNSGLFTMRLKLPADYKLPPHWHPADEHVTVVSGKFNMGMGDKFDLNKAHALPAGSFAVMPAKTHHFAFTKEETVVQLHGMGPWEITYVNAADDPRKK